jgi:hypothetical protein
VVTGLRRLGLATAMTLIALAAPTAAQNVQVSGLSDVSFGAITGFGADLVRSQSICAYSGLLGGRYTVTASGSGTGGAFTLSNGAARLPYEVQWSTSAGQSSGTNLSANSPQSGQTMLLSCPVLQATNASLIVILRSTALSSATAGNYSGTLTVILSAD